MDCPTIPVVQLRPDRLCVYNEFTKVFTRRGKNKLSLANLTTEKYRGNLSKASRKSMEGKIVNWCASLNYCRGKKMTNSTGSRHRLIMITVTLPAQQMHEDKVIKRVALNRLLITLKRRWQVERYVWKAEFQQNDNIHFHVIVDRFIPAMELRGVWNAIMSDMGYIDQFEKKNSHRNPNSTDIHQIYHRTKTISYMNKYMSKEDCCRLEGGAVWGCSDSLKHLRSPTMAIDNEVGNMIRGTMESSEFRVVKNDECTLIFGDVIKWMEIKHGSLWRDYRYELERIWRNEPVVHEPILQQQAFVPQAIGLKVSRSGSRADQLTLL